jgi:hypothetical protein
MNKALMEKLQSQEIHEEKTLKELKRKEKELGALRQQQGAGEQGGGGGGGAGGGSQEEELKQRISELEKENENTLIRLGSQIAGLHLEKNKLSAQLAASGTPNPAELETLKQEKQKLVEENKSLAEKLEETKRDKEDVVGKLADQFSMLQDQIALGMYCRRGEGGGREGKGRGERDT